MVGVTVTSVSVAFLDVGVIVVGMAVDVVLVTLG